MKHPLALLVIPAAVSLALSGSTSKAAAAPDHFSMAMSPASADPAPGAQHNEVDVRFVQVMVINHRQATEMAGLATTRASKQQVKHLAAAIKGAQGSEAETMTGWRHSWRAGPSSADQPGHVSRHIKKLGTLSGKGFDKTFLQMMISHHERAIAVARAERARGHCSAAKAMAASIIDSHTAQIGKMRDLLRGM